MNERFKQVLEEASKRVSEWPEWKKSEALKLSERSLESTRGTATQAKENSKRANSAAAGK
jgi:hypothetical protein